MKIKMLVGYLLVTALVVLIVGEMVLTGLGVGLFLFVPFAGFPILVVMTKAAGVWVALLVYAAWVAGLFFTVRK